jgi:hypothetical protein
MSMNITAIQMGCTHCVKCDVAYEGSREREQWSSRYTGKPVRGEGQIAVHRASARFFSRWEAAKTSAFDPFLAGFTASHFSPHFIPVFNMHSSLSIRVSVDPFSCTSHTIIHLLISLLAPLIHLVLPSRIVTMPASRTERSQVVRTRNRPPVKCACANCSLTSQGYRLQDYHTAKQHEAADKFDRGLPAGLLFTIDAEDPALARALEDDRPLDLGGAWPPDGELDGDGCCGMDGD